MMYHRKKPWNIYQTRNFPSIQKITSYMRKLVKVLVPQCTELSAFHLMRQSLSRLWIWRGATITWYADSFASRDVTCIHIGMCRLVYAQYVYYADQCMRSMCIILIRILHCQFILPGQHYVQMLSFHDANDQQLMLMHVSLCSYAIQINVLGTKALKIFLWFPLLISITCFAYFLFMKFFSFLWIYFPPWLITHVILHYKICLLMIFFSSLQV